MMLTTAVVAALTFAASPANAAESPKIAATDSAESSPATAEAPAPRRPRAPTKGNAGRCRIRRRTRGKRLVDTHDCHACHTPMKMGPKGPEPDMAMALSGHPEKLVMPPPPKLDGPWGWVGSSSNTAFAGPWGITYAINLTSDPDTGIGKWREEDFVLAMKTGKHLGVGPADHAADAVARLQPALRRRSSRRCSPISRPSRRSRTACPITRRRK